MMESDPGHEERSQRPITAGHAACRGVIFPPRKQQQWRPVQFARSQKTAGCQGAEGWNDRADRAGLMARRSLDTVDCGSHGFPRQVPLSCRLAADGGVCLSHDFLLEALEGGHECLMPWSSFLCFHL
ncbi:hypothetical protein ACOMHN_041282 [Nucella lapillus]